MKQNKILSHHFVKFLYVRLSVAQLAFMAVSEIFPLYFIYQKDVLWFFKKKMIFPLMCVDVCVFSSGM